MARGRGRPPKVVRDPPNSKKARSKEVKNSVPPPSKPGPLSRKPVRQLRSGRIYPTAKEPTNTKETFDKAISVSGHSRRDFLNDSVSDDSEVETSIEKNTSNEVKDQKIIKKVIDDATDDDEDGIDLFKKDYDDFSEDEDEEEILKNNNQLKKNVSKPKSSGPDSSPSASIQKKILKEKDFNASIDDDVNTLGTPKFASTPTRCITESPTPKICRSPVHDYSKLDLTKNTRDFTIIDSEIPDVLTKTPEGPAWILSKETSEKMTQQIYAFLGKTPPKKTLQDLNNTPCVPKTPGIYIDWEDKVDEIVHFGRRNLNETKFSEANTTFHSNNTFNSTNASDFTDSDEEENLDSCFSIEKYMIKPKPLDDILPDPSMVDNMIKNSRQIEDDEPMDCSELNPEIATELKENRFKVNQKKQFLAWRGIQLNSYTE